MKIGETLKKKLGQYLDLYVQLRASGDTHSEAMAQIASEKQMQTYLK